MCARGVVRNRKFHWQFDRAQRNGVPIQDIADTVGHKSTHVTETVYRHAIIPAIRGGATVMDIFSTTETSAG